MTSKGISTILLFFPLIACTTADRAGMLSPRNLNLHPNRYVNRIVVVEGAGAAEPRQRDLWHSIAARNHDFSRGRGVNCVRLIGADAVPEAIFQGEGIRVTGTYVLEAERVPGALECPGRGAIVVQSVEPAQIAGSRL